MGRRLGNLYVLDTSPSTTVPTNFSFNPSACSGRSADRWHNRLGHLGLKKLQLLCNTLSLKNTSTQVCHICPLAKQKRHSFPTSINVASSSFDLIHCDLWGPFLPITVQGYKFFLTIVDDCSRFVWTYLLKAKNEVGSVLSQFFTQVHTQFNKKIKVVRCDNGTEFSLPALFTKFGTLVQHSCVETPQQNARVERKHQHLLNVARSLFFQSNVPIGYWGECVLTASYLINRIPSSVLKPSTLTPFEALFQKNSFILTSQNFWVSLLCFHTSQG